jgi:TolB-like protein/CRP-like cAMP-binding protein
VAPRQSALLGLQKVDLFNGLETRALREIAQQCKWTRYKRNAHVIGRDTADHNVYFVIAGMVRAVAAGGRGRRITFRDIAAGEFFGEISAIDGRAGFADVVAVRESLLASMSPEIFRAILSRHASVRERLLRRLTGSVRELADRLVHLGAEPVQSRITAELLRLARSARVEGSTARIDPAPTHGDIASRIGTSREQVTRELSRLAREGLVGRSGRALIVNDVAALERLAPAFSTPADEPGTYVGGRAAAEERSPRQRRAILVAELSGAQIEGDAERAVTRSRDFLAHVAAETIPTHAGRSMLKVPADGLIAEFPDTLQALRCAFELHRELARFNAGPSAPSLGMRIGIHVAEVIVEPFNVLGEGVNVAARLAEQANPAETLASVEARDELTSGVDCALEDLGELRLRGRSRAVRAFRVWPASGTLVLSAPAARTHGRPSIAVVPFRVVSPDGAAEILGDGLAEETIAALSRVADFFVVSRLSSMAFRGRAHAAQRIGELLGVQYVVSGSLQAEDTRALLLAELADARDGRILWTERIEGNLVDLFVMQAEMARGIVERVAPFIRSIELQRARITSPEQLDAFGLLLRGIELMHKASPEEFARAEGTLRASMQRDPTSPLPYAWLAKWHVLRIITGSSPDPAADSRQATQYAEHALQRDPLDAVALAVSAFVAAWITHDLDVTERRVAEALAANANEPLAWILDAGAHAWRGRGPQAAHSAERAMSLSPLDPLMYFFASVASTANLVAGRHEEAIRLARQSLSTNRLHTPSLRALAVGQVMSGRTSEACDTVRVLRRLEPRLTVRTFRERYPGRESPQAEIFARALLAAGLPA